ncbi:MAG: Xaa-Pro peptidase family protein [archaeon GB-1867-035]|nr:Xaa-Pro peptidase family protein [Candidatus Culexmicrobium profundum]
MLGDSVFKNRFSSVKKLMEKEELNAFIVSGGENLYYLTNFARGLALLIFQDAEPILFVPKLEYEDAVENSRIVRVMSVERSADIPEYLLSTLKEHGILHGKIGVEENYLSIPLYMELTSKGDTYNFVFASKIIRQLRSVKDKNEIELIRRALQIAEHGMKAAIDAVDDGLREIDIAAEAEYAMRKAGAEWFSFETIVASGKRSAFPHGFSSQKIVRNGELVVIDIGAKYCGYCSDITRTVVVGSSRKDYDEMFNCIVSAIESALETIREGVKASDVDAAARRVISERGYGEYFTHGLGHGVGLNVHEGPRVSSQSSDILQAGNVITIEPGIYIPEIGGVRIEEMVVVTKTKYELLNKLNRILG